MHARVWGPFLEISLVRAVVSGFWRAYTLVYVLAISERCAEAAARCDHLFYMFDAARVLEWSTTRACACVYVCRIAWNKRRKQVKRCVAKLSRARDRAARVT